MHPGSRIAAVYLYCGSVDFRKAIDGLAALVERELGMSPFGDSLFVFVNRRRDRIKALYWHRNGFCLWTKRLEAERFAWPRPDPAQASYRIDLQQFEWLLEGFDLWSRGPHKALNFVSVS